MMLFFLFIELDRAYPSRLTLSLRLFLSALLSFDILMIKSF